MCTGRQDLCVYQGDDGAWVVTVMLEDGKTPADITGYTAEAQIRRGVADNDPDVAATIACTVSSPNVFLALTHAQTVALTGRYVWDLQLISPVGAAVTTILRGNVTVTAEVTREAST